MCDRSQRTNDRDTPVSNETVGAQLIEAAKWQQGMSPTGLAKVEIPVLPGYGGNDIMVPTISSFNLAQLLPDVKLSIYPDSGHSAIFHHHNLFVQQGLECLRD